MPSMKGYIVGEPTGAVVKRATSCLDIDGSGILFMFTSM